MAYATPAERQALLEASAFPPSHTVLIVTVKGREIELAADDSDHALAIQEDWLKRGARKTEIFRILADGELRSTIGPVYGDDE